MRVMAENSRREKEKRQEEDREKQKELERIDKEDERGRQILKQLHSIELAEVP